MYFVILNGFNYSDSKQNIIKNIISCLLLAISISIVAFAHIDVDQNSSSSDEQANFDVSNLSADAIHFFNKNASDDRFLVLVFNADFKQTVSELNEYVKLMKQLEISFFAFHFVMKAPTA